MSGDPSYSLIRAVRDGNVEIAKGLIETFGLSHSTAWSSGYNLLRDALQNEHEEMAKLLLNSGSKVNSKSKRQSETPLHFAVKNGYTDIVATLLDRHANIHAKNHSNDTPLCYAIERGCPKIVKMLVKGGAGIDARSMNGMTALHYAVQIGRLAIVEELLNHGAPINASCTDFRKSGYAALHYAAAQGNEAIVKLLLSRGAEINCTTVDKKTPLYIATESRREKVIKLLLESGANVDSRDKSGKTVLHVAVEKANLSTVENILLFKPDVNSDANRNSLYTAIKGFTNEVMKKIVEALLRYGFTVRAEDAKDATLLHASVECGYLKIVEALLKFGADVNTLHSTKKGVTLLHSAALYRQLEISELLLRHGANVNAKDDMRKSAICYAIENNDARITKLLLSGSASVKVTTELLHTAVKKESREIVEILLQLAPNIDVNARDKSGRTALHHTALNEGWDFSPMIFKPLRKGVAKEEPIDARGEMAKMFLARGALVNAKTKDGTSALHAAASGGYAGVVKVLLENKADVNSLAECRTTPLHAAAKKDNVDVIKMLLESGAHVNARQKNGTTALHIASKSGNHDVVKYLVDRNADLDARDKEKSTPLHQAAINGCSDVVETLLQLGASIEAKDKLGRTALHIAAKHGWPAVAELLLHHGADINVTCKDSMTPLDYATRGTDEHNDRYDDRLFSRRTIEYAFGHDDYIDHYAYYDDLCSDPDNDDFYDYFADDYDSASDCPCEEVVEILEQYIVAMKALDRYVSAKNLRAVDLEDEHRDTLEDCRMEIAVMKAKKIGDSNVSFYDVATRCVNQLAVYARNESIVQALEKQDYDKEFPSYSIMIKRRFEQGQKRDSLLRPGMKSLTALSGYALPDLSAIELFNYLSNRDLERLIKADPGAVDCDS